MSAFKFSRSKYRAKPTHGFPSKLEYAVYCELVNRERLGEIRNIKRQQVVQLLDCETCGTNVKWKLDFSFEDCRTSEIVYCEAKGVEVADYRRKLKQWKRKPPARLEIYKGSWQRPKRVEVIEK